MAITSYSFRWRLIMITYELAKELKDAGFPQQGDRIGDIVGWDKELNDRLFYPCLSELVEACGDGFGELKRRKDGLFDASTVYYMQGGRITFDVFIASQPSPEEAVAKLWLELNKK